MADGRDIDETDSVRIAGLFLAFIVITLMFEKLTDFLDKHLRGRTRRGLRHAVHHIEEELLALGLISLLLIVVEDRVLRICVDNDDYEPDKKTGKGYGSDEEENETHSRRLLADEDGGPCPVQQESFWSGRTMHQTHIFIFLIAVMHVLYATVSILICLWRMRRWKVYEDQPGHALKQLKNTRLVYGRNTFEYWFWSFWAQFSPAVDESLYLSMRCLFIERMQFSDDFDFLSFVVNTLVEEFGIVVRTDWVMWVIAAIWILVPSFLLVTTVASVLIVLIAGTKLEVIGVKLTQLAYLAYGDRRRVQLKAITAPNTLISKSVKTVTQKLARLSGSQDGESRGPSLKTQSLSVGRRNGISIDSADLVRRVHSFEGRSHAAPADAAAVHAGPSSEQSEILPFEMNSVEQQQHAPTSLAHKKAENKESACCMRLKCQHRTESFAETYHLPDSANLFWFKQPQLILRALRFVYFETAMAIALICFDSWQSSDFIIEHTNYFGNRFLLVTILISVGILCLLHTSFLMLPTYALTMVAGSHCPEAVLNAAKKMKISTEKVLRMEKLGGKSIQSQMNALSKPLSDATAHGNGKQGKHVDLQEQHISTLIGAMYKGRLERLRRQTSADGDQNEALHQVFEVTGEVKECSATEAETVIPIDDEGQSSHNASSNDEDMQSIIAVFGSFENFLEQLERAQAAIRNFLPEACFNFNCQAGSYEGRESTSFDTAAISLVLNLRMALLDNAKSSSA